MFLKLTKAQSLSATVMPLPFDESAKEIGKVELFNP